MEIEKLLEIPCERDTSGLFSRTLRDIAAMELLREESGGDYAEVFTNTDKQRMMILVDLALISSIKGIAFSLSLDLQNEGKLEEAQWIINERVVTVGPTPES